MTPELADLAVETVYKLLHDKGLGHLVLPGYELPVYDEDDVHDEL